jgi:hypothetical protein
LFDAVAKVFFAVDVFPEQSLLGFFRQGMKIILKIGVVVKKLLKDGMEH